MKNLIVAASILSVLAFNTGATSSAGQSNVNQKNVSQSSIDQNSVDQNNNLSRKEAMAIEPSSAKVNLMNWTQAPHNRWALRNAGILHTLMLPRGDSVYTFPRASEQNIGALDFSYNGKTATVLEALAADQTDGIVVLKDGEIVWEAYYDGFGPKDHHLWASGTKSLIGMAIGTLVERGQVNPNKKVTEYLPELKGSAWERASVQDTLNMSAAIDYEELMSGIKPGSTVYEYFKRIGFIPAFDLMSSAEDSPQSPRGVRPFLSRFKSNPLLKPGEKLEYHSPNVDVIGWLIERVSKKPLRQFLSEELWQKLQTEHDAFITADASFSPIATGGMNTTLRDFTRFAYAIMNNGRIGKQQVIPAAWVQTITAISDQNRAATQKSIYKNKTQNAYDPHLEAYKNFWWVHDANGVYTARGIFGQNLYIDKPAGVLIATFASAKTASNIVRESSKRKMFAFEAIAKHLK